MRSEQYLIQRRLFPTFRFFFLLFLSRDLKSENVLVWRLPEPFSPPRHAPDVHMKLADYGISRSTLPTGAKGFGGTEGFMAPEIVRYNGEEEYTEKVGGGREQFGRRNIDNLDDARGRLRFHFLADSTM